MPNSISDCQYFDKITEGIKEALVEKRFDLVKEKMNTLHEFVILLEREENALKKLINNQ